MFVGLMGLREGKTELEYRCKQPYGSNGIVDMLTFAPITELYNMKLDFLFTNSKFSYCGTMIQLLQCCSQKSASKASQSLPSEAD